MGNNNKNSTNIVDHDIAEKLLVNKSTEHEHLRFADVDYGVTTENIPKKSKTEREFVWVPARLGRSATEISRRISNPVMHFLSSLSECVFRWLFVCLRWLVQRMKKQLSIQFFHKFCLSGVNVIIALSPFCILLWGFFFKKNIYIHLHLQILNIFL